MSVADSSYYSCTCEKYLYVVYGLVAFQINSILADWPEIFWDAYQLTFFLSSRKESELLFLKNYAYNIRFIF